MEADKTRIRTSIRKMIDMVKNGQWTRDVRHKESRLDGSYCALGMAGYAWDGNPHGDYSHPSLIDVLDRAITELPALSPGAMRNGGTMRGVHRPTSRVASYNNTVKDEDEIVAWFERALELV